MFLQEQDYDFLYIALELCHSTLQDLVEGKYTPGQPLEPVEILRQTAAGINHLHSLKPRIGNTFGPPLDYRQREEPPNKTFTHTFEGQNQ